MEVDEQVSRQMCDIRSLTDAALTEPSAAAAAVAELVVSYRQNRQRIRLVVHPSSRAARRSISHLYYTSISSSLCVVGSIISTCYYYYYYYFLPLCQRCHRCTSVAILRRICFLHFLHFAKTDRQTMPMHASQQTEKGHTQLTLLEEKWIFRVSFKTRCGILEKKVQ